MKTVWIIAYGERRSNAIAEYFLQLGNGQYLCAAG
jgi:hypothetical protein